MIPALNQLAPISHPVLDTFLLGFNCASALVAALFFLRFWRSTRDTLFMAFVLFFAVQGFDGAVVTALPHPNIGSTGITLLRLAVILGLLGAIVWKNVSDR